MIDYFSQLTIFAAEINIFLPIFAEEILSQPWPIEKIKAKQLDDYKASSQHVALFFAETACAVLLFNIWDSLEFLREEKWHRKARIAAADDRESLKDSLRYWKSIHFLEQRSQDGQNIRVSIIISIFQLLLQQDHVLRDLFLNFIVVKMLHAFDGCLDEAFVILQAKLLMRSDRFS